MKTESTNTIAAAFCAAQAEMTPVTKDRDNPYFKSNYATLLAICAMLRPILAKHGLAFWQGAEPDEGGRAWMVTHVVHGASGAELTSRVPLVSVGQKPQDYGSAITYAKRYGLQCAFGVVVAEDETDDDGNRANGNHPKPSDYGVCPCGKSAGKTWVSLPTETLKAALTRADALQPGHVSAIKAVLATRKDSTTNNNQNKE